MKIQAALSILLIMSSILLLLVESKSTDLYKVLGVDPNATQREIQKAFHKLSLQYHPDKNKEKGAQEKFAEINNAYDILSDEEKRKKYDLYGDEKGAPGFDTGGAGDHGAYSYFTHGGPEQQSGGGSRSYSFHFGGPRSSRSSFDFDLNSGIEYIFSNMFGGNKMGGHQFGCSSSGRCQSSGTRNFPQKIPAVNERIFRKGVVDKGITWLLLSYTSASSSRGMQYYENLIGETASTLEGALKVGSINCEAEISLCREFGLNPRSAPRVFVYSYQSSEGGSLVEYNGELDSKNLKTFCHGHLPKFSKRVNLGHFDFESVIGGHLPKVLLLTTKKNTPVIWRTLSGLYHKHFVFYDAEAHDVYDPTIKRLGVDSLPAIVGWLSNGEKHTLKAGISGKDLKSAIQDISIMLDKFEKLNKAASGRTKWMRFEPNDGGTSVLTESNFADICGEKIPVCIIGVFRSPKAKDELEKIFLTVSKKSLTRRQNIASGLKESVSYGLLDAAKQQSFLTAFDKTGFKSKDKLLLAYKPRKSKFATLSVEVTVEKAEDFIGSVLNGDIMFSKTQKSPVLK